MGNCCEEAEVAEQVGKMVEHPKLKSTQPRFARIWATLYSLFLIFFQILMSVHYEGSLKNHIECISHHF